MGEGEVTPMVTRPDIQRGVCFVFSTEDKRDGHLLVAFFGDSSYGWFAPAELIPFDPHYEEKSKQTTLRPFVIAVEEATDERSRREALALTCYCRNKFNFRPARVLGYFHADVPGFEPGGIHPSKQIEEARNKFVPDQVLSYVKQTAVCPLEDGLPAIDLVKKVEMLAAYRQAVLEEFDETYAQAFGVELVQSSPPTRAVADHPERFSLRGINHCMPFCYRSFTLSLGYDQYLNLYNCIILAQSIICKPINLYVSCMFPSLGVYYKDLEFGR